MYYNPTTKETLSAEETKIKVNASFPEGTEEVFGWHLIDERFLYPHLLENQYAVPTGIDFVEGKYVRTYAVKERKAPVQPSMEETTIEQRFLVLENAIMDLARMMSNPEEYRRLLEKQVQE
jgi:hypothetical protein